MSATIACIKKKKGEKRLRGDSQDKQRLVYSALKEERNKQRIYLGQSMFQKNVVQHVIDVSMN